MFGRKVTALPDGWRVLSSIAELDAILAASESRPQLLFKHSTRCSISDVAFSRLKDGAALLQPVMQVHYLDLIAHRDVSNAIAERLQVAHESPQTLLVYKGECVLDQSHSGIIVAELLEVAQPLQG